MHDLLPSIEGLPAFSDDQVIVRLQPFSAGGFEGVCYYRARDSYVPRGVGNGLSPPGRTDVEKLEKQKENARRAKQSVRRRAREIGVDRLVTLTTRESNNKPVALLDRVAAFVKEYNRAMRPSGKAALQYVAVPEPHPSNPHHWHVHMAIVGYLNIRVANVIWWRLCGGRGAGNIDIRKKRARCEGARSARIARYISKYITKNFEAGFDLEGRHRFRASVGSLQAKRVWVLASKHLTPALDELLRELRVARGELCVCEFADGGGFWFSFGGDGALQEPPF